MDEQQDTNTGKVIYRRFEYDHANRETFRSYPSSSSTADTGIGQIYDALGRLTVRHTAELAPEPTPSPTPPPDPCIGDPTCHPRSVPTAFGTTSTIAASESVNGTILQQIDYLTGFKQHHTDADGKITTLSFQAFDQPDDSRPVKIEAEEGQTTAIQRDHFGHITRVTQSGGGVSATQTWTYDNHFQLCRKTEPETASTVMGYDAAGQLIWQAWGQSGSGCLGAAPSGATYFKYDDRGRLEQVNHPGSADDIDYGYDANGNLISLSNATAAWSYDYNARNLLESEQAVIDGKTFTLKHQYNGQGHVKSREYPDGHVVDQAPDAWGRPTKLGSHVTGVDYHPNGLPSGYTYGNGLSYNQTLNSRQWPRRQRLLDGVTAVQDLEYDYSDAANLTAITDHTDGADSVTMTYDGLHRLNTAAGIWGTYSYSYDALNNLRSRQLNGNSDLSYSYNATTNRLTGITGAQSRNYSYTARGQVTGDGQRSFSWNAADRIASIPGVADYAYDGHGRRIKTSKADGTLEYALYDLGGSLAYTWRSVPESVGATATTTSASSTSINQGCEPLCQAEPPPSPPRPGQPPPVSFELKPLSLIAPTGLFPGHDKAPGPTLSGSTVTLRWNGVPGVTLYRLRVYDTASGATVQDRWIQPHIRATTSGTSVSYTVSLSSGKSYRWHVGSCIGLQDTGTFGPPFTLGECPAFSPFRYFQTPTSSTGSAPATPSGLAPGSASSPGPTTSDKSVTLSWSTVSGATSYTVQAFNASTGATVVNVSQSATSRSLSLDYETAYRWRVRACNANGCSSYASYRYFETPAAPAPDIPTNLSPGSTSPPGPTTSGKTVTLSWSAVSEATSYTLQVFDEATLTTVLSVSQSATSRSVTLDYETGYLWRVRACNSSGCSAYAPSHYFQTPAEPVQAPATPSGLSPGSTTSPGPTTSGNNVMLSWSATSGAESYTLQVYNANTGSTVLSTSQSATSRSLTLNYETAYRWRVRACNTSGCSTYTSYRYFQTPAEPVQIPATPTGPSPGSTTSPGPTTSGNTVTLSWSASSGAETYTLQVFNADTGTLVLSTSQAGTSRSVGLSYETPYRWRVRACNSAGCSAFTAYRYFQTPAEPRVETQTSYLSLGGQTLVARKTEGGSVSVTYLHPDLLGSPRRATGAASWREHYDPYGMKLNGVSEKIGYTGHAHDAESGLTYMQARFYDPLVGRFLSADPVGFTPGNPFGFNRYAYANNNPYKYIDPDGRCGTNIPNERSPATICKTIELGGGQGTGQQTGRGQGGDTGGAMRQALQGESSNGASNPAANVLDTLNSLIDFISGRSGLQLGFNAGLGPGIQGSLRVDEQTLDDGTIALRFGAGKVVVTSIPPVNVQAQFTFDVLKSGNLSGVVTSTGGCAVFVCVNSLIDTSGNTALRVGFGPVVILPNVGITIGPTVRRDPFFLLKE